MLEIVKQSVISLAFRAIIFASREVRFRVDKTRVFVVSAARSLHYARPITRQLFNSAYLSRQSVAF